jgi:hypothetical protein
MEMKTKSNTSKAALAALCLLILSPAVLFAGNSPKTAKERGIIKSVDNSALQIVVTDHKTKTEGTFRWNDQTKFTEHHQTVNAGALKEGLPVYFTYVANSDPATLKCVRLEPTKKQTHAAATSSLQQKP